MGMCVYILIGTWRWFFLVRIWRVACVSFVRKQHAGWMAPEVLRGEKFDETSDLYSFGVVLWEMLTLEQPWKEVDPIQLPGIVGFQGRRLRLPSVAPPGCPLDYISLIADCWHHHPQRRPKMREVVSRLTSMCQAAEAHGHADSSLV